MLLLNYLSLRLLTFFLSEDAFVEQIVEVKADK